SAGDPQLNECTLRRNLRVDSITGPNTTAHLLSMDLPAGVNVCAGYHPYPLRLRHCFLLEVIVDGYFASHSNVTREALHEYVKSWLASLLFIRRVEIRE
ncbi:hypothetical protein PHMEG_00033700, partial [Phytophthora megakarya]